MDYQTKDGILLKGVPDGTPDEEVKARIAQIRAGGQQTPTAAPQEDKSMGFLGDFGRGALSSAANIGQTLLKPVGWFSTQAKEYLARSQTESDRMASESGFAGKLGGLAVDIAGTGGITGLAKAPLMKAAQYLPKSAAFLAGPTAQAVVENAAAGAYLSPKDPLSGAEWGGIGGGVGQQVLSRTLGRVAKPIDVSKFADAEALMSRGVPLTVGQAANPNTMSGRGIRMLEETMAGAPFVGAGVKGQREAARQAWRDIPLADAAATAGVRAPSRAGWASHTDMQGQVKEAIGKRYDELLAGKELKPTEILTRNLDDIVRNPKLSMTEAERIKARNLVEAHVYGRQVDFSGRVPAMPAKMSAEDVFKAQSDLRSIGHKSLKSDLSSERAYGQALIDSADEIYNFIGRRFPQIGKALQDLRAPYAELSLLKKAAGKAAPRGEFSPTQLGKLAGGNEELRNWSAMAEPILTKDPGGISEYGRLALLSLGGVLAGVKTIPAAAAALLLFGTKGGQKTMMGQTKAQQALSELLRKQPGLVSAIGGVGGREAALGLTNTQQEQ